MNKYALLLNDFRVIPRIIVAIYGYGLYEVVNWFMALPEPTNQHTGFVSTFVGIAPFMFNFYYDRTSKVK